MPLLAGLIIKPNIVHEMNVTTKEYGTYFNWVGLYNLTLCYECSCPP